MANWHYGSLLVSHGATTATRALSGEVVKIPAGNRVVIGFDRLAHHLRDGSIQPIDENAVIEGYSSVGVVQAIMQHLLVNTPLKDMLDDYDMTPKEFQEEIYEALEEIGLYRNGEEV